MNAAGIGHNKPPEETIEEVVRTAQQTRDLAQRTKAAIVAIEAPFLEQAKAASSRLRGELTHLDGAYDGLVSKVARWQEARRKEQPFADPKEMSRVIIDGEVEATARANHGVEIFKPDMVPRELCKPDDAKIKAVLAADPKAEIPGVRRTTKYSTIIR